ncbi:sigma factor [Pedobacter kyungheensis]|uniref:RNA polymerase sigma factor n=1 Tax=Pedobacter kyungheensis TaxID=1069985 RepID=UPI0009E4EC15
MLCYAHFSDLELADLLKGKDEGAFTDIYNRYWAVLYCHARRLLLDDEEAEDLTQEVFLTLLNRSGDLELSSRCLVTCIRFRAIRFLSYRSR